MQIFEACIDTLQQAAQSLLILITLTTAPLRYTLIDRPNQPLERHPKLSTDYHLICHIHMPHQNKSETEDAKRKKKNELKRFDKLYSVSRCYKLI